MQSERKHLSSGLIRFGTAAAALLALDVSAEPPKLAPEAGRVAEMPATCASVQADEHLRIDPDGLPTRKTATSKAYGKPGCSAYVVDVSLPPLKGAYGSTPFRFVTDTKETNWGYEQTPQTLNAFVAAGEAECLGTIVSLKVYKQPNGQGPFKEIGGGVLRGAKFVKPSKQEFELTVPNCTLARMPSYNAPPAQVTAPNAGKKDVYRVVMARRYNNRVKPVTIGMSPPAPPPR